MTVVFKFAAFEFKVLYCAILYKKVHLFSSEVVDKTETAGFILTVSQEQNGDCYWSSKVLGLLQGSADDYWFSCI